MNKPTWQKCLENKTNTLRINRLDKITKIVIIFLSHLRKKLMSLGLAWALIHSVWCFMNKIIIKVAFKNKHFLNTSPFMCISWVSSFLFIQFGLKQRRRKTITIPFHRHCTVPCARYWRSIETRRTAMHRAGRGSSTRACGTDQRGISTDRWGTCAKGSCGQKNSHEISGGLSHTFR